MADNESGTLAANTVRTITLASGANAVEITNVDGAARIAVTVDGTDPDTAGAAGTVLLPALVCEKRLASRGGTVVKLKSTGTPLFSVNVAAP